MFYPYYLLKHIQTVLERSNSPPVHTTTVVVVSYRPYLPKICLDWVSGASEIIKIKAEKGFKAYVSPNYTL